MSNCYYKIRQQHQVTFKSAKLTLQFTSNTNKIEERRNNSWFPLTPSNECLNIWDSV